MNSTNQAFSALQVQGSTLTLSLNGHLQWHKSDGSHWQTNGPLLVLHYYDRCHPCTMEVSVPSGLNHAFGTAGTPSLSARGELHLISTESNKLRLQARFVGIDIELWVSLELRDEGRELRVTLEDVQETTPQLYRVLSVEILPFFGAVPSGQEGSLTLPNWSGCRTYFDKTYPRQVRQAIYSSNDEWANNCNAPVWAITAQQGTLCGLITQGDYDARLVSYVHWEENQLNGSHAELIYRWEQQDDLLEGPREVRYFTAASDAPCGEGYVFCGQQYRDFLRAERGVQTWVEKAAIRPEATEYLDRFFLKIFMAYKEPQADGNGPFHAVTTLAEARLIIETLLERGMNRLAVMLVGWGQDGHDGMRPTQFPVEERLGGEDELRELIVWCQQQDVLLGVHDGYGVSYSCSPEHNEDYLIRHRTGEAWAGIVWSGGQAHLVCPAVYIEQHVKRDMPRLAELGLHGHHHIDAIGSFMSCFSEEHPLERRADFTAKVAEMFEFATQTFGGVSTEYPFGPYFSVVDGFFHTYENPSPWHRATPVGRFFLDESVPLLPVALHGSHNCHSSVGDGSTKMLLAKLDWGLVPQTEVSYRECPAFGSPAFETRIDALQAAYELFYGDDNLAPYLGRLDITARHELAPQVFRTRYSDGTELIVNLGNSEFLELASENYQLSLPVSVA